MNGAKVALWAVIVIGLCILVGLLTEVRGQGRFDQPLIVESSKQIRRVVHWDVSIDIEKRFQIERSTDASWLDGDAVEGNDGQFVVPVMTGIQSSVFRTRVSHRPHLVVAVQFEDGTFVVRVADIPPGMGQTPIVIRCDP